MKTMLLLIGLTFHVNYLYPSANDEKKNDGICESGFIHAGNDSLFYEISGEGEWIVLLHDGIVHSEVWDGQFDFLAEKYRVVRYDRRGYGRSSYPQNKYSNIEDLRQVFTNFKIPSAIVFGISGGGKLAIDFALKYPEKVDALVLAGAVVGGYYPSTHALTRGGRIESIMELLVNPQNFIEYLTKEDPYEIYGKNKEAKKRLIQLLEAYPNDVYFSKELLSNPPDRQALRHLSEIQVPVLVLVGEYDMPDIHANAGIIEIGIPNAKREVILNSGHLIPFEQPESFNRTVNRFLASQAFLEILNTSGIQPAVEFFIQEIENNPGLPILDENELNSMGYRFLKSGKVEEAIEIFKLNVRAYPTSSNVYDSLGEGYMNDGQTELAIENYEKSLELNPNNTNASEFLKKLKGTK